MHEALERRKCPLANATLCPPNPRRARATISGQFPASTNQELRLANCAASICRPARNRHAACRWLGATELPCFLGRRRLAPNSFRAFGAGWQLHLTARQHSKVRATAKSSRTGAPLATSRLFWGLAQPSQPGMYRGRGPASEGPDLSARIAAGRLPL